MYCLGIFTYCTSWTKLTLRLFCHIIWQCCCTTSPLFRHLLLIHLQIIKSFITKKISPDPWLGKIQNFTFIFHGLDFFFFLCNRNSKGTMISYLGIASFLLPIIFIWPSILSFSLVYTNMFLYFLWAIHKRFSEKVHSTGSWLPQCSLYSAVTG